MEKLIMRKVRGKAWWVLGIIMLLVSFSSETTHAQRKKKKKEKEASVYDIDTLIAPIPRQTQLWHIKIDKAQKGADVSDGMTDGFIDLSTDDSSQSITLSRALLADIDKMEIMVENMPANNRDAGAQIGEKQKALRAIEEVLKHYNNTYGTKDPYYYRKRVNNLKEFIIARNEGRGMAFIKENVNILTMDNIKELYEPTSSERYYIFSEMGKREPRMMIKRLAEFANEAYADDVVTEAAKIVPNEIFNYASSTNYALSNAVKRSKDPLVQAIVRIAQESKSPLKAMPFLNDIYTKRYTIAEIDKITANEDLFFQNLVRLKMENVQLGGATYTDELKYRGLKYVRTMNELHDEKDPVRFKCVEGFSPYSLYFLMVYGQDEVYTSSFLGMFNRMMDRMKPMKGNELLDSVHRDKFRTFIRMCAGYNTLGRFLDSMEVEKKNGLMQDFIAGLEQGKEDDLEDAVDVADAFGSIQDSALVVFLQNEVKKNYERSYTQAKSKKGVIVYGLLATLFEGSKEMDSNGVAQRQSELLNIPPINKVMYENLTDDSGIVYEQFFFYGDKDGLSSYANFLGNFKDGKWKKTENENWCTITSTTGKPVVVFANKPLAEPQDEEAQKALNKYLEDKGIKPAIIVHRGHSYHLPITLDHLVQQTKIVMLGSCGGYHNLGTVLDKSPDAHIISSKQVGAMKINEPIIKSINDQLLAGKEVDWINTWKGLTVYFGKQGGQIKEMFDDYIPPHKNLGAIFIKAYRRMLNSEDAEEG
jgi:hypothetical protein